MASKLFGSDFHQVFTRTAAFLVIETTHGAPTAVRGCARREDLVCMCVLGPITTRTVHVLDIVYSR